jgi:hypothetical protein
VSLRTSLGSTLKVSVCCKEPSPASCRPNHPCARMGRRTTQTPEVSLCIIVRSSSRARATSAVYRCGIKLISLRPGDARNVERFHGCFGLGGSPLAGSSNRPTLDSRRATQTGTQRRETSPVPPIAPFLRILNLEPKSPHSQANSGGDSP